MNGENDLMSLEKVRDVLDRVISGPVTYDGNKVIISFSSHNEAMTAMFDARRALAVIKSKCA